MFVTAAIYRLKMGTRVIDGGEYKHILSLFIKNIIPCYVKIMYV